VTASFTCATIPYYRCCRDSLGFAYGKVLGEFCRFPLQDFLPGGKKQGVTAVQESLAELERVQVLKPTVFGHHTPWKWCKQLKGAEGGQETVTATRDIR
jgi:hypothetical protein